MLSNRLHCPCLAQAIRHQCRLSHLQIARVLALLAYDDSTSVLAKTLQRSVEQPGAAPSRVWCMWIPQLLAGLGRTGEGRLVIECKQAETR